MFYSLKNFKFKYNDSVKKALINGYDQNQDFFSLLLNNEELKERFMKVYMEDIYKELKKWNQELKHKKLATKEK